VRFEECNLMLVGRDRDVVGRCLDREVIEEFALVDGGGCLRNELGPQHALAIPFGSLIDGNLGTLL
jgi:hypothetical protein